MSRTRAWGGRRARAHPGPALAAAAPAGPANRRTVIALAAVVATGTLLLAGLLLWLIPGGATSVPDDPGPPAVAPAAAYRAVYRVDDTAGPRHEVQTDVVEMQRPDRLRVEHRDGPPPGAAVRSGSVVNGERHLTLPEGVIGFATPLTMALDTDVVAEPALRAAVAAGRAERRGDATLHGERCTSYVYRQSGTEALTAGDDRDHVESCITPDGIPVRQAITIDGRLARIAELGALDRSPHFGAAEFAVSADVGPAASVVERVIDGRPTETVVRGLAPAGFRLDRELTDTRQEGDAPLLPYFIQGFASGGEFVVVEQLMLRETAYPPWTPSNAMHLDLGDGRSSDEMYHTGFVEEQLTLDGYPVRVLASRAELARYVAATVGPPA